MIKHALFGVLGLTMLPGCPLLDAEVEVHEVCMTYPDVQVDGVATGTTLQSSFTFNDLSRLHTLVDLDANLQFVRGEVRAKSGITDFSFVHAAHVTIASGDPSSTLPTLDLFDCSGNCVANGQALELPAAVQQEAVEYVRGDSVIVGLDFDGQLPAQAWSMDVDVCLNGHVAYSVTP